MMPARDAVETPSAPAGTMPIEPSRDLPLRTAGTAREILQAVGDVGIWTALAHRDIRARYRRTVLGPFWIVILVALSAAMIAIVYGTLFGQPTAKYFVFVVASLVSWTLIANVISEAAAMFWLSGSLIRTFQISPVVLVLSNLWKNVIVWCHAIGLAIVGAILFRSGDFRALIVLPIGLSLVILNLGWISLVLALAGARFRDVYDLVLTLMALAFLLTPVIWDPSMLGDYRSIADFNPLAHLLDLVRRPAMGEWPSLTSFIVAGFGAVLGWVLAGSVFVAVRTRLPLWI